MSSERWQRVKELFRAALERNGSARDAFLTEACADDRALLEDVQRLLAAHEEARSFMEQPAAGLALSLPGGDQEHAPTLSPGQLVSERYLVVRFIAEGGMAEVYEAEDIELRSRVALKIVRPSVAGDRAAVERFKREIALARKITHPNVCRTFDLGHHRIESPGGAPIEVVFLTMELLHGETLAERIERHGPMPFAEALPIVTQIADGLAAAHQQGIIHRDFKSSNVMLVPSDEPAGGVRAVITDFGLARLAGATQGPAHSLTATGMLLGTPAYMSPEQIEGKKVGVPSDIYALGLVMYEMATGAHAFTGESVLSIAAKRLKQAPVSPRVHMPHLDQRWDTAILRCLEPDPADRFASVADVARALRGEGVRPSLRSRRRRFAVMAGAAAILATVVSGLWMGRRPAGIEPSIAQTMASLAVEAAASEEKGDLLEAQRLYRESLKIGLAVGDTDEIASTFTCLGRLARKTGDLEDAKQAYQRALASHRRTGCKDCVARDLIDIAGVLLEQGDLTGAETAQKESLNLFQAIGRRDGIASALFIGAEISLARADVEQAGQLHEQALRLREELGDREAVAESRLALSELMTAEGYLTEAEALARAAVEGFRSEHIADLEGVGEAVLAEVLLAQRKLFDAQAAIARASPLGGHSPVLRSCLRVTIAAARIDSARGNHAEALKSIELVIARAEKAGMAAVQFEARLARGEIEIAARASTARSHLETLANEAAAKGFILMGRRAAAAAHPGNTNAPGSDLLP